MWLKLDSRGQRSATLQIKKKTRTNDSHITISDVAIISPNDHTGFG